MSPGRFMIIPGYGSGTFCSSISSCSFCCSCIHPQSSSLASWTDSRSGLEGGRREEIVVYRHCSLVPRLLSLAVFSCMRLLMYMYDTYVHYVSIPWKQNNCSEGNIERQSTHMCRSESLVKVCDSLAHKSSFEP